MSSASVARQRSHGFSLAVLKLDFDASPLLHGEAHLLTAFAQLAAYPAGGLDLVEHIGWRACLEWWFVGKRLAPASSD